MDDSQANNDYLADRLRSDAEERRRRKQAEVEQQRFQKTREALISELARSEYENLVRLLKERVEKIRSDVGNLPEFVVTGSYIQLGRMALYYTFDQPVVNHPTNELVLSLGLAPLKQVMFGSQPQPAIHKLQAVAAPDRSTLVWRGKLGQFDSAELAEFALEMLIEYYCRQTSK